ncbi:hypothetical protein G6O69_00900 [Pseudenhygromyxa sp. WMMC2535]|uniref:hypothetical protein n=1 Tax=Pseudenhygromyxa sp. WMMC2535 TaxID=2712867 RepID=UPI0015549740|nr:hypothetical protein [Pseudenhygromyxa sp. WMMC2535]NVB36368.1 hypothetical protein [Pseudenhygromyxa sp. WMMC2535]
MRAKLNLVPLALVASLTLACGDSDDAEDAPAAGETAAGEGDAGEGEAKAGEAEGEVAKAPAPPPDPITGPDRFKRWSPLHAFMNAPIVVGEVISDDEAIVASKDGHVGLSVDGGASWRWTKADDRVVDVTGYSGGPYVVLYPGAISISDDGLRWRRLPRLSEDDLIDVLAAKIGVITIGKRGGWARYTREGEVGGAGWMPDKFKPKTLAELNGAVLAWSGRKGYGTTDGSAWTELEALPQLGDGRTYLTSAGSCSISKVGKAKGVVCSVSGTAFGIGEEFAVESRGAVALTRDSGESWISARLPVNFKSVGSIFGRPGGPYYAVGKGGAVALSKDGSSWVDQRWQGSTDLTDGVIDGDNMVIVGAKGTLIYSNDGGKNWDYAEAPAGKNFNWVGAIGGNFLASDGRVFLTSADGTSWSETEAFELPGKLEPCDDDGPLDGEACRYDAEISTPEGLPNVRALTFDGEVGMAMGDDGLVALTRDGGAGWAAASGLALGRKGASAFDVVGDILVATNGSRLLTSLDGGGSWFDGEFVGKPRFNTVMVVSDKLRLAAGKNTLLAAKADSPVWLPVTEDLPAANWVALYQASGIVYAAASGGELLRSVGGSGEWEPVVTGISRPVIDLAAEGELVWIQVAGGRYDPPTLMYSEDGGRHFVLAGPSPSSRRLKVRGGGVEVGGERSTDGGRSWTHVDGYQPGEELGDGKSLAVLSQYKADDQLALYSQAEGELERLLIVSAALRGGQLDCDPQSGCWMLASGVLYRPLGR